MGSEGSIFVGNGAGARVSRSSTPSSKIGFRRDYQARFSDAFRAEIADFVAVCAAAKHGDAASATGPSSSGAGCHVGRRSPALETGVAARASAVQSVR